MACPLCAKSGHTEATRGQPLDDCDVHSVQGATSSPFCLSGEAFRAGYHSRTIEGGHRNDDKEGGLGVPIQVTGKFSMTLRVTVPTRYIHKRYLGRPSCPKCGELLMAPEHSKCLSRNDIRHFW